MLFDRRRGDNNSGRLTTIGVSLLVYGLLILCYHLAVHEDWLQSPVFLGFLVLSLVLALVSSINRVSIHAYYRARLSGAFLPRIGGERHRRTPASSGSARSIPDSALRCT